MSNLIQLHPGKSTTGQDALEAMDKKIYDLVLLDCHMPRMDGYETAVEIRKRERSKIRVPIGSSFALRRTAALASNLIKLPSPRRTPLAVRTTTALYTSPFLTLPRGAASLTLTLMTSPIEA